MKIFLRLQQAKIDSLTGTTPLGEGTEEDPFATTEMNNGPSVTEDETPLDTGSESMDGDMSMGSVSPEGDMSTDPSPAMDGDGAMSVENPSAMDGDMSVATPPAMEGDSMNVDAPSAMEGDMSVATPPSMEGETPLDTGSEYMDDATGAPEKPIEEDEQRKMGGTKRRKNKQRKTKRKRKGSKK